MLFFLFLALTGSLWLILNFLGRFWVYVYGRSGVIIVSAHRTSRRVCQVATMVTTDVQ